MFPIIESSEQLDTYFNEAEVSWLLLLAADDLPYLFTYGNEGDPFTQTFPYEDGLDRGTSIIDNHPSSWWPVRVVAQG